MRRYGAQCPKYDCDWSTPSKPGWIGKFLAHMKVKHGWTGP